MTGKTLSIKGMLLKEENLVGFSCRLFAIIGGQAQLFSKRIELVFEACISPHCLLKLNNQFNMQHKTLVPVI
jgi:hypothetical protein